MSTSLSSVFCVVFYTSYRKENDWRIHKVFRDKESAMAYAMSISRECDDDDEDNYHVEPNHGGQKIWLRDRMCGIMDEKQYYEKLADEMTTEGIPVYTEVELTKLVDERHKECESYDNSAWAAMSWTPLVAVVEQSISNN